MRIAHLIPALTRGGAERVAVALANQAVRAGHQVTIVVGSKVKDDISHELDPGVALIYVGAATGRVGRYIDAVRWLRRNWSFVTSLDVVHCHLTWSAVVGTLIYEIKRRRGGTRPAVVETYHAVGLSVPFPIRVLHRHMSGRRDALALMAEDARWSNFIAKRPRLLSATIPNGIQVSDDCGLSPEERRARQQLLGIPEQAGTVVGTVGRLATERRPWIYPEIFGSIARALGPDVHFVIAGDGPERERVQQAIVLQGFEGRIHMTGLMREPAGLYPLLDLYVTINVGPTTGIAALEAASMGVPVVAVQLLREYAGATSDWIWSSPDLEEVAQRAVMILRDPAAKAELATRQKKHVREHHNATGMAQSYCELYRAALGDTREGRSLRSGPSRRSGW